MQSPFKLKSFYEADYGNVEKLIQEHYNIDIHTLTASEVFKISYESVTPLQRSWAKALNHWSLYTAKPVAVRPSGGSSL